MRRGKSSVPPTERAYLVTAFCRLRGVGMVSADGDSTYLLTNRPVNTKINGKISVKNTKPFPRRSRKKRILHRAQNCCFLRDDWSTHVVAMALSIVKIGVMSLGDCVSTLDIAMDPYEDFFGKLETSMISLSSNEVSSSSENKRNCVSEKLNYVCHIKCNVYDTCVKFYSNTHHNSYMKHILLH